MTRIVVDPATLATAATDLRESAAAIDADLADYDREVATLDTGWEGDANDAFMTAQGQWRNQMKERAQMLRTIAEAVENSSDLYTALDRQCGESLGGQ